MNILYLCDEYPPCQHGGIGKVTQLLARAMAKKKHNVFVAGFYPYYRQAPTEESDEGVKVSRFFYGTSIQLQLSKRNFFGRFINIEQQFNNYINFLNEIIKGNQIDIIESPDFSEAFRYSGPRMIEFPDFGIPLIVKLHGSYSVVNDFTNKKFGNRNIYQKEKKLLSTAHWLIAVSASVRERVKSKFNLNREITVLHNGILQKNYVQYKAQSNTNAVVFAGTLSENKGIYSLISAWEKVIKEIPSASLSLYGKASEISMSGIKQLISEQTKKSIYFKGFAESEDLPAIYSNASCAVFPSYSETFGMAAIEAMAVGCPTIFTKRTSGPEIIEHRVDGILIEPDNIQDIADAIIVLLKNREFAIQLGQKGFAKVRDCFDINLVAEKHEKYYAQIIYT